MSRAELVVLAGILLTGLGMVLVFAGILVPGAFFPGVYLVGAGLLVLAAGALLAAGGRRGRLPAG